MVRKIIRQYQAKLLKIRSITRTLETDEFAEAYRVSNDFEKVLLEDILKAEDKSSLKKWVRVSINKKLNEGLDNLTVRRLRRIAGNIGIRNYVIYNREGLILKIREVYHEKTGSDRGNKSNLGATVTSPQKVQSQSPQS